MTVISETRRFRAALERESERTIRVLETLPGSQYDFRPDPKGRSIGELAWHLSEIEGCLSYGIEHRRFRFEDVPPGLGRPREVHLLAGGYARVHADAMARLDCLRDEMLEESVTYFDGHEITLRQVLWGTLLHHLIHHRGQLVTLCRMAGGMPPGLYGPNREEMAAIRAASAAGRTTSA